MESSMWADWCYRCEGNCNMLFSNKKSRRVYRVLKVNVDASDCQEGNNLHMGTPNLYIQSQYSRLLQFNACVMDRLYLHFLSVPRMKSVDVSMLKYLSQSVRKKRPEKRLCKTMSLCPFVLDIPDYAFLPAPFHDSHSPSFMFELKAGSVARSYPNLIGREVYEDSIPRCNSSRSCCYFCINRSMEHDDDCPRMSRYCPQDLFSGDFQRMRSCLAHLLEDMTCVDSKLRLFKDGVDITMDMSGVNDIISLFSLNFGHSKRSDVFSELVHLLMSCLTYTKPAVHQLAFLPPAMVNGDVELSPMSIGCVLTIFAHAQCFGASTVKEVQAAYNVLESHIAKDASAVEALCINGPYDTGLWRLGVRPEKPDGIPDDVFSAFLVVRNYLIYRTAKDASILITFQRKRHDVECEDDETNTFVITDTCGAQQFYCNVVIVDLDLKPFSKMKTYLAKEWDIHDKLLKSENISNM